MVWQNVPGKLKTGCLTLNVRIPRTRLRLSPCPGGDTSPVEVGSGFWHWSVPHKDPERGPYTVDDLIGDITTIPEPVMFLWMFCSRSKALRFLMGILLDERNIPLREALFMLRTTKKPWN